MEYLGREYYKNKQSLSKWCVVLWKDSILHLIQTCSGFL